MWRLLLIVSMFLFWRFSKFFEFFEKRFRVCSSKLLTNEKVLFLFLCVLFVVFKLNHRFRIFSKSWFSLIDLLNSRRFRIFRRVFLLICFRKSRRFLIFDFFYSFSCDFRKRKFLRRFREFVDYRFSKIFQKRFRVFFNFSNNSKKKCKTLFEFLKNSRTSATFF